MSKEYVASSFEGDKEEYDKTTGSSTGTNTRDSKSFASKMKEQAEAVASGKFLSSKGSKLEGLLDKVSGAITGKLSLKGLQDRLQAVLDKKGSILKKAGLGAALKIVAAASKIVGGLIAELGDILLSKIFIPDPVYVGSLIAFDALGADLEYRDNYIRKLMLRRDITMGIQWWNKEWNIKYSGLRQDSFTKDLFICASSGAYENVRYIAGEFDKARKELISQQKTLKEDDPLYRELSRYISEIRENIVKALKDTIVYSYSNFSADELKDMLVSLDISPSVFGIKDSEYGGRYAINVGDINSMAPFFKPTAAADIENFSKNKGSRSKRAELRKAESTTDSKESSLLKYAGILNEKFERFNKFTTFINPRNRNIKRLYIVMTDSSYGNKVMYNPALAERLGYKIISTLGQIFSRDILKGLIPQKLLDKKKSILLSAYNYTKEIEHMLYDPSKALFFNLPDFTVIKMPADIPSTNESTDVNKIESQKKKDIEKSIGTTLIPDSIKKDTTTTGKDGIPKDLDKYIKNIVDEYLSLNLEDMLKMLLDKLALGQVTMSTSDTLENMIFKLYKESGLVSFLNLNGDQVFPIIVTRLKNNTYNAAYLRLHTLMDIINIVVNELKSSNTYISVVNDQSKMNYIKLIMEDLQSIINEIIRGNVEILLTFDINKLINDALVKNSQGILAKIGELSDQLLLVTNQLNDKITKLSSSGSTNVDINSLLGGISLDKMIQDAIDKINKGYVVKADLSDLRLTMLEEFKKMLNLVLTNVLTIDDIPSLLELSELAKQVLKNKLDISEILDALKAYGIDVKNYDLNKHKNKYDKLINTDPGLLDFDVLNPPVEVINDINDEYATKVGGRNMRYKWINIS